MAARKDHHQTRLRDSGVRALLIYIAATPIAAT
jgi:hypothetical protein